MAAQQGKTPQPPINPNTPDIPDTAPADKPDITPLADAQAQVRAIEVTKGIAGAFGQNGQAGQGGTGTYRTYLFDPMRGGKKYANIDKSGFGDHVVLIAAQSPYSPWYDRNPGGARHLVANADDPTQIGETIRTVHFDPNNGYSAVWHIVGIARISGEEVTKEGETDLQDISKAGIPTTPACWLIQPKPAGFGTSAGKGDMFSQSPTRRVKTDPFARTASSPADPATVAQALIDSGQYEAVMQAAMARIAAEGNKSDMPETSELPAGEKADKPGTSPTTAPTPATAGIKGKEAKSE